MSETAADKAQRLYATLLATREPEVVEALRDLLNRRAFAAEWDRADYRRYQRVILDSEEDRAFLAAQRLTGNDTRAYGLAEPWAVVSKSLGLPARPSGSCIKRLLRAQRRDSDGRALLLRHRIWFAKYAIIPELTDEHGVAETVCAIMDFAPLREGEMHSRVASGCVIRDVACADDVKTLENFAVTVKMAKR